MALVINVLEKPTFDIQEVKLKYYDEENRICYLESKQVFRFDKVYGFLNNRSRVTRINMPESTLIEQIISATIDAGYNGKLVWKVKLTKRGMSVVSEIAYEGDKEKIQMFKDCQQIHLYPFPSGNYYRGQNQTDLEPDIIFVSE